ncbi:hypothetical protein ACWCXB_25290 [Streptomyces sp. NPDC001514]
MPVTFDENVRTLLDGTTAELVDDPDKTLPYELSHKYLGIDPPAEKPEEVRVIVRIIPERVIGFAP